MKCLNIEDVGAARMNLLSKFGKQILSLHIEHWVHTRIRTTFGLSFVEVKNGKNDFVLTFLSLKNNEMGLETAKDSMMMRG